MGVALLAVGATSHAIQFTDIQQLNQAVWGFDSYSRSSNIITTVAGSYTISGFISGNGRFTVEGGYTLEVPLNGTTALFTSYGLMPGGVDMMDGLRLANEGNGGLKSGWFQEFTANGNGGVPPALEANAELGYEALSDPQGFSVEYARFETNNSTLTPNVSQIPGGGTTVALLGLGLIGIAVLMRILAPRKKADTALGVLNETASKSR